ncbi:DHA2 family efflux MFS transporter permease subunit [Clostridium ragsdalei]|uniref:DHA2 family efflux MFS transporter permease subunit n=1 Tax=Clostridium ragsdalei TaxID=217158 RepID=UPI0007EE731F|nr:DHA2 family efflux MFS transporter permease subunit [Clostridium ragsdalei]
MVGFIGNLDISVVNIALPSIEKYFNSDLNTVMWVTLIFALVSTSTLIPICKLGDMFGRKKVLLICLIIFSIASIICAVSSSLNILILGRGLQALGASALMTISIPLALEIFPKEKRNLIAGIWGAICALAIAVGPSLGGYIIQCSSWKYIFFINIPICLISFILIFSFIEESFNQNGNKSIDFIGTIILAVALSTLTYSLIEGNNYGFTSKRILALFILSAICFIGFTLLEKAISNPIIDFSLFKIRSFSIPSCTIGFITIISVIFTNFINFFFNGISNYTASESGNIIFFYALGLMISSIIAGKLTTKFKTSTVVFFSVIICIISIFLVIHVTSNTTKLSFIIILFIAGLGSGAPSGQLVAYALSDVPNEKSGLASGLNNIIAKLFLLVLTAIMTCSLTYRENIAFNNTKKYLISNVSSSQVLDKKTKDIIESNLTPLNKNNFNLIQKNITLKLKKDAQTTIKNSSDIKTREALLQKASHINNYLTKTIKTTKVELKKNYSNAYTATFKLSFIFLGISILFCPFVNPNRKRTEA